MKKILTSLVIAGFILASSSAVLAQEEVLFSFDTGLQGWEIPTWAFEQPDHVQQSISLSDEVASDGDVSLKMETAFPGGGTWSGAVVEIMQFFDWSDASVIACDFYVPENAPEGFKGSIILTVGDDWTWVEMSRSVDLVPGEWITVEGDISPGSIDWRRMQVDESFRQDVRKITVRVHYNNRPSYDGPIYIDNVRIKK